MNEIETKFLKAFEEYCGCGIDEINEEHNFESFYYFIEPQKTVGIYKPDFVLTEKTARRKEDVPTKIIVEIDGHESHKTKEQRKNDYTRERYFLKNGYVVIRFMGTEVFLDADKCVEEVVNIIMFLDDERLNDRHRYFMRGEDSGYELAMKELKTTENKI